MSSFQLRDVSRVWTSGHLDMGIEQLRSSIAVPSCVRSYNDASDMQPSVYHMRTRRKRVTIRQDFIAGNGWLQIEELVMFGAEGEKRVTSATALLNGFSPRTGPCDIIQAAHLQFTTTIFNGLSLHVKQPPTPLTHSQPVHLASCAGDGLLIASQLASHPGTACPPKLFPTALQKFLHPPNTHLTTHHGGRIHPHGQPPRVRLRGHNQRRRG